MTPEWQVQHLPGCESWLPLAELCHCPCPIDLVDNPDVVRDGRHGTQITWDCCGKGIQLGSDPARLFPEQIRAWHLTLSQYETPRPR